MSKLTKGYKTGKAQRIGLCCREIRICPPKELGDIAEGMNTISGEYEFWMLIKKEKRWADSVVQRIYK